MEHHTIYAHRPRLNGAAVFSLQPPGEVSLGGIVVGVGLAALAIWGLSEVFGNDEAPQRACGVCGRAGHNRRNCPYESERLNFSRSIPRSNRCECCGSSRYPTQRHHTRGRSSLADFLDVCFDCHIDCCHEGDFQNLGRKPQVCRHTGVLSYWRA